MQPRAEWTPGVGGVECLYSGRSCWALARPVRSTGGGRDWGSGGGGSGRRAGAGRVGSRRRRRRRRRRGRALWRMRGAEGERERSPVARRALFLRRRLGRVFTHPQIFPFLPCPFFRKGARGHVGRLVGRPVGATSVLNFPRRGNRPWVSRNPRNLSSRWMLGRRLQNARRTRQRNLCRIGKGDRSGVRNRTRRLNQSPRRRKGSWGIRIVGPRSTRGRSGVPIKTKEGFGPREGFHRRGGLGFRVPSE